MNLTIVKDSLSYLDDIQLYDPSAGSYVTGKVAADLNAHYFRQGDSAATSITLADGTLGSWVTGQIILINDTTDPGSYQFSTPNAMVATGADWVELCITRVSDGAVLFKAKYLLVNGNAATGVPDSRLANHEAHGGTLGDSDATLGLSQINVTADNVTAVHLKGGSHGQGLEIEGYGTDFVIGSALGSVYIEGGADAPAIHIDGPYTTPGPVIVIDATAGDSGLDGGPGILVRTGAGDAVQYNAVGGKSVNLLGDGTIWDGVNNRPVSVTVEQLLQGALAQFFTTDSGKTYLVDAVAGSVVKEVNQGSDTIYGVAATIASEMFLAGTNVGAGARTVTMAMSVDGGATYAPLNTPTTTCGATGGFNIVLTSAEMSNTNILVKCTATGCDPTFEVIRPTR